MDFAGEVGTGASRHELPEVIAQDSEQRHGAATRARLRLDHTLNLIPIALDGNKVRDEVGRG
jgi:hypothetical protein